MKNILVPNDFSEAAENALKFSIKIAHAIKGKIFLTHAITPILVANDMGGFVYPNDFDEESTKLLHDKMDKIVESVKLHHVEVEKVIKKGLLQDTIDQLIEREKIDMVITGTHGAKGFEAFFFGTNSENIFERVKCPVLIVPEKARYHSIKKIMYATDFQYGDIQEIEKISHLAKLFNAQIVVTHVNSNWDKFVEVEETMDWFAEIGNNNIAYKNIVYKLLYNKNVIEALEDAITLQEVDILCMSTVEKDFFNKIISKSNTKEMAFHSRIPLMTLHLGNDNKLK